MKYIQIAAKNDHFYMCNCIMYMFVFFTRKIYVFDQNLFSSS